MRAFGRLGCAQGKRHSPFQDEIPCVVSPRLDIELRGKPERGLQILESAMALRPIEQLAILDRPYLSLARVFARAGDLERAHRLIEAFEAEVLPTLGRSAQPLATFRSVMPSSLCN